jgi:ribonuclease P protein component
LAQVLQRLKTRPQFQAVLGGLVVAKTNHFALHRLELGAIDAARSVEEPAPLFSVKGNWLGAMAPKRWARRAVTRNAIKRQIYTLSASFQQSNLQVALLVRLRREFSRKDYKSASSTALKTAVHRELLVLIQAAVDFNKALSVSA